MGRGVCLSVCPVPQHNSRTEISMKPKFGRMEAHHTSTLWTYLEVKRSGRPTNFKLGTQTEHKDPHKRQAPWTPRSKVRVATSRDVSGRCWPISRERNVLETPKLVETRKVVHPTESRTIMHTSFNVKGQRSRWRSPGRLALRPEVRHNRPKRKAYELETWYTCGVRRTVSPTSAMKSCPLHGQ